MNTKKIEELEQTIKQAQKQIEELKKENETPKFEYPRIGQTVWMINEYGNIDWIVWSDTEIGKNMVHLGMLFFTKEEAKFERERRKVIAKLKLFAEPDDREWNAYKDGCNEINEHWFIMYSHYERRVTSYKALSSKRDDIYFETEEDCQRAINYVGEDRVKKYYLRVKD